MPVPAFQLPLEQRPELHFMARAVHGRKPVEHYRLPHLWCLHLYRYSARFSINGSEFDIRPGDVSIVPANAELTYWFKERSEHLVAHFKPSVKGPARTVPLLRSTGHEFSLLHQLFEEGVGMFPTQPLRAEIRLWDILWSQVRERKSRGKIHPAISEVIQKIELRLHEPLQIEALAKEVGISHNHLTRLFQAATGKTVKAHLIERRMGKALHLLKMSSLPIKSIAYEVGMEDLHAFNKAVRRHFGRSPRAIRQKGL